MSIVTLKKKTLAQYHTQNTMISDKKEVSYCTEKCRGGKANKPAYTDLDQTYTGRNTYTNLPQSTATPSNTNDLVNKLYVDNLMTSTGEVTLSTAQTITGVKTFSVLPQSNVTPSNADHLVNKNYVDSSMVNVSGTQTITGLKTFSVLPKSNVTPSNADHLVNKNYVDSTRVAIYGNQDISGVKTFLSLPQSSVFASNANDLVTKSYVDLSAVTIGNAQTISGLKTFSVLPQSSVKPSDGNDLVNKSYVDLSAVAVYGNQDISGVKTFLSLPRSSVFASNANDLVTKSYVDLSAVTIGNTQTISGLKTFSVLPQSSVKPLNEIDLVNKRYADSVAYYTLSMPVDSDIYLNDSSRNSVIYLKGGSAGYLGTVYLQPPSNYTNSTIQFVNDSSLNFYIDYDPSGVFGKFGQGPIGTLLASSNTATFYSDGNKWSCVDKSVGYSTFKYALSSNYAIYESEFCSEHIIAPSVSCKVTLVTSGYANKWVKIYNFAVQSVIQMEASGVTFTDSSVNKFTGNYGSYIVDRTYPIPPGTWALFMFNGATWDVVDKMSGSYTTYNSVTSTGLYNNFLQSYTPLSATGEYIISSPAQAVGKYIELENLNTISANYITLKINSNTALFSGVYGSDVSGMILPAKSSVKMYSNGVNWLCVSIGGAWSYYADLSGNAQLHSSQWFNSYSSVSSGSNIVNWRLPMPQSKWENLETQLYSINCNGVTVSSMSSYNSTSNTFTAVPVITSSPSTFLYSYANTNALIPLTKSSVPPLRFKVIKTSFVSSTTYSGGALSVSQGSRLINITTASPHGTIGIGTDISCNGQYFKITSLGTGPNGTCSGSSGGSSLTLNKVTGNDGIIDISSVLIITGATGQYITAITAITNGTGGNGSVVSIFPALGIDISGGASFTTNAGFCTGVSGESLLTLNKVIANGGIINRGSEITITGSTEGKYLITDISGNGGDGSVVSITPALNTSVSSSAFFSQTGTGGVGTYVIGTPASATLTTQPYSILNESFAWMQIS